MQRRALWLIVCIGGGVLLLLGSGGGLLTLALALAIEGTLTTREALSVAGMLGVGLGFGLPLILQGWSGWRGRPSRPFNPSGVWCLWLALMLLLGLGTAVSALSLSPVWLLPPVHALTMALPPLIMLWLAGRALRGTGGSWREVVTSMAGGGSLALGFSLLGEGVILLALIAVVTVVALVTPGGAERVTALAENLQHPDWWADFTNLAQLLLSPAVAISALGMFSIPIPLVEEAFKTLAAGVIGRWVRPHPARAFLWGVASGAGFALAENLFNGALGGAESWAIGAVARFGATVMHCATGGLVGWGWGQLWTARRPLRLLLSYVAAVTIHGMWNFVAVGMVLLSASAWVHAGDALGPTIAGLGTLTLLGLLGLLTVAFIFALSFAGRRLATETEQLQDRTASSEKVPL